MEVDSFLLFYNLKYTFLDKQLGSGPTPQSCLYFQDLHVEDFEDGCFVV